jgi:hypothetical protein
MRERPVRVPRQSSNRRRTTSTSAGHAPRPAITTPVLSFLISRPPDHHRSRADDTGPIELFHAGPPEGHNRQLRQRLVEPNSGLGQAIQYMRRHWRKLTQFLKVAGAPLDNNICERALKLAILHRKNALFYKTHNGAHVGDLFMSLIHTCRLGGVDPFAYLNALQRHAVELAAAPAKWMPWNYRDGLRT